MHLDHDGVVERLMRVLREIVKKELLQLRRDRRMLPLVFLAPAIQLLAMGYAANLDVQRVPTLLVDLDGSAASRRLAERFVAGGSFRFVGSEPSIAGVDRWLARGDAQLALVIGQGFGADLAAGRTPQLSLLADGSDSTAAGIGLAYASGQLAAQLGEAATRSSATAPPIGRAVVERRVWYNPDLRSRWFYVPAVLAMVLLILTLVLSSMGIVREKEIGTMEQLIVTPIRPWQLVIGKLFPFALIGLVDTFVVTGIALALFGVPLRGSLTLLVLLTQLLLLNTLGLGLLVSTLVQTQQQAMMTATFVFMVPQIYLSGLIFPIENMPALMQQLTLLVPLRYYAVILRGIFLKGAGIATLWPQAAALAAFGVSFLLVASMRFRKRLE